MEAVGHSNPIRFPVTAPPPVMEENNGQADANDDPKVRLPFAGQTPSLFASRGRHARVTSDSAPNTRTTRAQGSHA